MSQFHAMHARTGCLGADAAIQRFKRRKWRSWADLDVGRVVQNLSRTIQLLKGMINSLLSLEALGIQLCRLLRFVTMHTTYSHIRALSGNRNICNPVFSRLVAGSLSLETLRDPASYYVHIERM